mgnify:CR=1 FL=1
MRELLSVIVPCYNEGAVIERTAKAIVDTCTGRAFDFEIIFVNDGSKDDTLAFLKKLAGRSEKIKYISFSRNFGKEAAMLSGLEHCKGSCAVIMDADLQHPPELIVQMYEKYQEGYDQVIAKRNRKGDSRLSIVFAKLYYKLANKLVNVEMVDGAGDFRLLSRRTIHALLELKENNRFSKGLFSWVGFNQIYIEYENQERAGGNSKWSFKSLLSYGVDGILSPAIADLHLSWRDFYGDQYPLSAVSADRDPASWDRCTGIFYDDPSNHDVGRNPAFFYWCHWRVYWKNLF